MIAEQSTETDLAYFFCTHWLVPADTQSVLDIVLRYTWLPPRVYITNTLKSDIDLARIGGGNVVHIGREILNLSLLSLNWRSFTERWYGYWRQIWRNLLLSKRVKGCDCKSLMLLSDGFYDSSIALILYYNNINPVPTKIFCDSNKIMLLIKQNKILFL